MRAVRVGVLYGVDIEVLVHRVAAVLPAAECHRLNRPGALHPRELVDLVNVIVAEDAAAGPQKPVEEADLVQQFRDALGLYQRNIAARPHAVAAHGDDVSDLPVADAVEQFLPRPAVPYHQPDSDFQVLAPGLFAERDHAPRGGTVHGDRLLHEDVQAPVDGIAEMHPPECRRRSQDGYVARLQAVHGLTVAVEADELAIHGHVHLGREPAAQVSVAVAQLLREDIGHGHQLDGSVLDSQRVLDGAGAAPAASHQRELNRIVLGRVHVRQSYSGQGRNPGDAAGFTEERAARRGVLRFIHRRYLVDYSNSFHRRARVGTNAQTGTTLSIL